MYCMPKRYADSVVRELLQKDQLVRLTKAQEVESEWARAYAANLRAQVDTLHAVVTATEDLGDAKVAQIRRGRNVWRAIGVGSIALIVYTIYTKVKEDE